MVLGSHTDTFYMGEGGKARYLGDEKKPLRKRVCKICGEDCPVWAGFEWDGHSPLYAQVAAHVGRSVIIDSTKDERWIETRAGEVRAGGGTPILLMLSRDSRAVVNSRLRKYPDRFSWVYDQHIRSVMDFFKDRPDDLLVIDICSGEGFEKLAPFLDRPVPTEAFPHKGAVLSRRMAEEAAARKARVA